MDGEKFKVKKYIKLEPKVMQYDWGNKTFIPNLLNQNSDNNPKAELWIGTHSGAPSTVENGKLFSTFLEENPNFLGKNHLDKYGTFLPLLFKILAIEKPLSIQCHPSVEFAKEGWKNEELYRKSHSRDQWNYKDDNRKAEVIYALTPITAMSGFASFEKVNNNLKEFIPFGYDKYFKEISINEEYSENDKLKEIFQVLYRMDDKNLSILIEELINNIKINKTSEDFLTKEEIIASAYTEYPMDAGLFMPLLLNIVHLNVGDSLYLEPRVLHAYVFGNGIELMSASDNVLRGGLTHKKMDVDELLKVMLVRGGDVSLSKKYKDKFNRIVVDTPTEEFSLIVMQDDVYNVTTKSLEIIINTGDNNKLFIDNQEIVLNKGDVYAIASNISYRLSASSALFCATI